MSSLSLSFWLGARFFKARRGHASIRFFANASMWGIALGIAVLIAGLSVMNGFNRELNDRVLALIPHGELEAVKEPISQWRQFLLRAESHPQVQAAAPYIPLYGLVSAGSNSKAVQLRGIEPTLERQITHIEQYLHGGTLSVLSGDDGIILGESILRQLQIKVGERVTLLVPVADQQLQFKAPKRINLTVVDSFAIGGQLDGQLGFVNLALAQQLRELGDAVEGIAFRIDDPLQASAVTRDVGYSLNYHVYLKSWMHSQGHLYQDIQLVRTLMYVIMLLVVAVACFNIVSTLMMTIAEKRHEFAILLTQGLAPSALALALVGFGLLNGVMGVVFGVIFGSLLALVLPSLVGFIDNLRGEHLLNADVYFINFVPSELLLSDVLMVCGAGLLLVLAATLYPAWQASRIQPAYELNYSG